MKEARITIKNNKLDDTDQLVEITIKVRDEVDKPPALKAQLIHWLHEKGVNDYVEGVIDGIHLEVDDRVVSNQTEDPRFATAPILIYRSSLQEARDLCQSLATDFGDQLQLSMTELTNESWQQAWDPDGIKVQDTERFRLIPIVAENRGVVDASQDSTLIPLRIVGGAFGSGDHATTMALLHLLEGWQGEWSRAQVLDLGTGTGVLAIAAAKLGAAQVWATDIDEDAVACTIENKAINQAPIQVQLGSFPAEQTFNLVVSNILAPVLHQLSEDIVHRLRPGGHLMVAGFIEKEAGPLQDRFESLGLRFVCRRQVRGWLAIEFENP